MNYKNIVITGGAGFVGSAIGLTIKKYYPFVSVTALDNLMRRGSELNVARLKKYGVTFVHGDVRNKEDLDIGSVDLLIECSAEPSVMAGVTSSPEYLLQTNLVGAINCFELARRKNADVIFLSTSRVYPITLLNELSYTEEPTRFSLAKKQTLPGASKKGISEAFPLTGTRSLYGTTKLAAELLLAEYIENYGMKGIINRFGLITGPWQMGKVDQGIIVLWMARHIFGKPLRYIGFGGSGKQVRDLIHVDDVCALVLLQIQHMQKYSASIYNVGGGVENSVSLLELTDFCQKITKKQIPITKVSDTRKGDVKAFITDTTKIQTESQWRPEKSVQETLEDIYRWIVDNKQALELILE